MKALLLLLITLPLHAHYDALGIGTAMTDLIITASDEFVERHAGKKGGSSVVTIAKVDEILAELDQDPVIIPGGSCANTLKGLARLGIPAAYHLRDGIDEYGIRYEENLKQNNLTVIKVEDQELPSGRLVCLVTPDKNRTFLSVPSAGAAFCPQDLQPSCFKDVKLVHLDGYSLRNKSLVEAAMKLAKANNATVSFDPGCFQLVREHKSEIFSLLEQYVDILFLNEQELKELSDLSATEACRALSHLVEVCVVLQGQNGCLVGSKNHVFHCPSRKVEVVDTTGAGDLFASGFLYGVLSGSDLHRAAYIGNYLGSTVIQHMGAEIPDEEWPQILAHIAP